jgi:hypothetical protein
LAVPVNIANSPFALARSTPSSACHPADRVKSMAYRLRRLDGRQLLLRQSRSVRPLQTMAVAVIAECR